jgi:cytochrome P450
MADTGEIARLEGFHYASDPGLVERMWERWDELRGQYRFFQSDDMSPDRVWIMTRYDDVHEALRDYELFSSECVQATDEVGDHRWIPEELDPPEHGKYRQLLTTWFAPGSVSAMEPRIRELCIELIEAFEAEGNCDFYEEFARLFPTTIFMELMGLPIERSEILLEWAHKLMHTPVDEDPEGAIRGQAVMDIMGMLGGLLAERRADPREDLISALLAAEIDGEPMSEEDLLQMSFLLYMGGLDTVAGELGAFFHHLATHPEDRQRIVDDPALIPNAAEELLRAYSIVSTGRVVTRDVDFHGCPMKAGDRVLLPTPSADRDPEAFENATAVDLDRTRNRHMAFGAGPHRCVGSNLARLELTVALEEWHRRIPDYRLDTDQPLRFHSGGVAGFEKLPLVWS